MTAAPNEPTSDHRSRESQSTANNDEKWAETRRARHQRRFLDVIRGQNLSRLVAERQLLIDCLADDATTNLENDESAVALQSTRRGVNLQSPRSPQKRSPVEILSPPANDKLPRTTFSSDPSSVHQAAMIPSAEAMNFPPFHSAQPEGFFSYDYGTRMPPEPIMQPFVAYPPPPSFYTCYPAADQPMAYNPALTMRVQDQRRHIPRLGGGGMQLTDSMTRPGELEEQNAVATEKNIMRSVMSTTVSSAEKIGDGSEVEDAEQKRRESKAREEPKGDKVMEDRRGILLAIVTDAPNLNLTEEASPRRGSTGNKIQQPSYPSSAALTDHSMKSYEKVVVNRAVQCDPVIEISLPTNSDERSDFLKILQNMQERHEKEIITLKEESQRVLLRELQNELSRMTDSLATYLNHHSGYSGGITYQYGNRTETYRMPPLNPAPPSDWMLPQVLR